MASLDLSRAEWVELKVGSWRGKAEVARGLKALLGLMFRETPSPMLFPLKGKGSFWMPFVKFPLLLVFVRGGRVVKVVKMEPCRVFPFCKIYKGEGDYAIELPVGIEVKVGDHVKITAVG